MVSEQYEPVVFRTHGEKVMLTDIHSSSEVIRVCVRVKSMDDRQTHLAISENELSILRKHSKSSKTFTFDRIISPDASQEDVYRIMCQEYVSHFFNGFNITIFAYGQTYSGKTYTSGLNDQTCVDGVNQGIAARALEDLFARLDGTPSFSIKEKIRDLITTQSNDPPEINIREDTNGEISVSGLVEKQVEDAASALEILKFGSMNRSIGDTKVSSTSSRSHAIFTIILEKSIEGESPYSKMRQKSKLHLVDLAGSERLKKTGAEGLRFRESVKINSSLLVLGNVINALSENQTAPHIPYRESKLTRLLQDSLGGNAKTLMIACINSNEDDIDETINTLEYAQRTRKIKNNPIKNIIQTTAGSPEKSLVPEHSSEFEEEVEFKKIYSLMKQKSTRLTEANKTIGILQSELISANEKMNTIIADSQKQRIIAFVSKFTQTETMNAPLEDLDKQVSIPLPDSAPMNLLQMQNLTPEVVLRHMYSTATLVEEDIETDEGKKVRKLKVEMSKNSNKMHKEIEKIKQTHMEDSAKLEKEIQSKERKVQTLQNKIDFLVQEKGKVVDAFEKKIKVLESQVINMKSVEKQKARAIQEKLNLEKKISELEIQLKRQTRVNDKLKHEKKKDSEDPEEDSKSKELEIKKAYDVLSTKFQQLSTEHDDLKSKMALQTAETSPNDALENEVIGKCNATCKKMLKDMKVKLKSTITVNNKLVQNITRLRDELLKYRDPQTISQELAV